MNAYQPKPVPNLVASQPVPESAIEADIKGVKKFVALLKEKLKQARQPAPGGGVGNQFLDAKMKKVLIIAAIVFAIFAALLIATTIYRASQKNQKVAPTPAPTATPVPLTQEVQILNPSRYATDSAVLSIESDLKAVERQLVETEIKETRLTPPSLDFEIKF